MQQYKEMVSKLEEEFNDPDVKKAIDVIKTRLEDQPSPKKRTAWDRVLKAREKGRPKSNFYINALFDDFIELHGDRAYGDDASIIGGIGMFNDIPVTVIGNQKGEDLSDNVHRNFGMAHPEGYRKSLRLMKQAEKFNRPIITFVDTPGAYCGIGAEERGQSEAIARNLYEMSSLKVPILCFVIGEGGSGGALALSVADEIHMLSNSIYSVLSPEGYASILWKDATKASKAADVMKLTAKDLYKFEIVDSIIEEKEGFEQVVMDMKETIQSFLGKNEFLLDKRYEKYRKIGQFQI